MNSRNKSIYKSYLFDCQINKYRSLPSHLLCILLISLASYASAQNPQTTSPTSITIVTDASWDVSGRATPFNEYPLSAEQIASATSTLYGGNNKAVVAETNGQGKVPPGATPIWRTHTVTPDEGSGYQFRKTVPLGPDRIQKATLEVNCDDVARVYINKRLVSVDQRDGKLKDGSENWFTFRSVSGFTFQRLYTYDVADYLFTNVTNTIFVEAFSLDFSGSHAYFSARLVIETVPMPVPAAKPATKPAIKKTKPQASASAPVTQATQPDQPEKNVFEAGRDPEIEKLKVGSVLELGNVYFKANDYKLDENSYRTLDALVAYMKRYPSLKIEIGGHTNLRPSKQFADELSNNRARSVMWYLTDNGVPKDRVTFKGYGKKQPRVKALSKEADKENQRVEIKVLEK